MKLYVWVSPYTVSYGSSLLVVASDSVENAKALAVSEVSKWYSYGKYPDGNPNYLPDGGTPNHSRSGWQDFSLGEPNRVVDLPCAEWHRWEE